MDFLKGPYRSPELLNVNLRRKQLENQNLETCAVTPLVTEMNLNYGLIALTKV